MTTDEAIAEINARGFRVLNLFQLASDRWRANIRPEREEFGFKFAEGPTAVEALRAAMANLPPESEAPAAPDVDLFG